MPAPEGNRDRHSANPLSSVKAPAKKDGAGGSFVWGDPMQDVNYATGTAEQMDSKDPMNDAGEPSGGPGMEKRDAGTSSEPASGTAPKEAPERNTDNFPELGLPGAQVPPPSGAWGKP